MTVIVVVIILGYTFNPGDPKVSQETVRESKVLSMAEKGAKCSQDSFPSAVTRLNTTHFQYT